MSPLRSAGTYALIMENETRKDIAIGKHGNLPIRPGFYIYIGSAFGPGGVSARVSHHIKIQTSPHWHIDYLRQYAGLIEFWYSLDPRKREHQWALLLEKQSPNSVPMTGFGSSDCQCTSHLFFSSLKPDFSSFKTLIRTQLSNHSKLYRCHWKDLCSPKTSRVVEEPKA